MWAFLDPMKKKFCFKLLNQNYSKKIGNQHMKDKFFPRKATLNFFQFYTLSTQDKPNWFDLDNSMTQSKITIVQVRYLQISYENLAKKQKFTYENLTVS